jgi:putative Mg2+ transporter-C (MgtC) family protein
MPVQVDFILQVSAALLMGLAIGIERQLGQHPAGLRTNALVCVGAALFVSLSRLMDHEGSPTRIAAQVASGIGFLGGGVILREGLSVKGMTTAATIWCSAAVGSLAGAGHPWHAAVGTGLVLTTNIILHPVSQWLEKHGKPKSNVETSYRMRVVCEEQQEGVIRTIIMRHINSHPRMVVQGISTHSAEQPGRKLVVADIESCVRDDHVMQDLLSRANAEPGIASASWERLR